MWIIFNPPAVLIAAELRRTASTTALLLASVFDNY